MNREQIEAKLNVPFTQRQWWSMCDKNMSHPMPLNEADLDSPWVYYRPWGLMYVPSGYHQGAMSLLYAFHNNQDCYMEFAKDLSIPAYRASETMSDRFLLEVKGTAFKSSVGRSIVTGSPENLNARERQAFRKFDIQYL